MSDGKDILMDDEVWNKDVDVLRGRIKTREQVILELEELNSKRRGEIKDLKREIEEGILEHGREQQDIVKQLRQDVSNLQKERQCLYKKLSDALDDARMKGNSNIVLFICGAVLALGSVWVTSIFIGMK